MVYSGPRDNGIAQAYTNRVRKAGREILYLMFCIWPDDGSMSRNLSPNFLIVNSDYNTCCIY